MKDANETPTYGHDPATDSGYGDPKGLQFTPLTYKALRIFGDLVQRWTLRPETRPEHTDLGDGRFVVSREAFRSALLSEGLTETASNGLEPDFKFRDDVTEIELIERSPERFSILLPEPDILGAGYEGEVPTTLEIPVIYGLVDYGALAVPIDDCYPARVSHDFGNTTNAREFLSPYMAAYICAQCA